MRRLAMAAAAIAVSGLIAHRQISTMLVQRGDVALVSHAAHASSLYRRALFFDPGDMVAVDRLMFLALLSHNATQLHEAMSLAATELERHPGDSAIRMDRALCEQVLRRYDDAENDFETVGRHQRDARALLFAADDESRLGHASRALALLETARLAEPGFIPVTVAIRRMESR
jgi:tetratricopeptide (TPR) repeat protein